MNFNTNSNIYYKFIAPYKLASKHIPITKENLEREVKILMGEIVESGIVVNVKTKDELKSNDTRNATTINISQPMYINVSEINAPLVERIIAPQVSITFDKNNGLFGYNKVKHIDVLELSSSTGVGIEGTSLSELETLILRANFLVVGLYGIIHDSKIANGNGYIYVDDELFSLYKLHYVDTPSVLNAIKCISEIKNVQ